MAKLSEIEAAILVSPKLAVIGIGSTCVVLDIDRQAVTHRCALEAPLTSAALSPTGKQIALGLGGGFPAVWTLKGGKLVSIDTTEEVDGEMRSMGGWTLNAQPLGWVNDSRIVMSACYGGVIVADPAGEAQGAKYSEDELWFDDEISEHKMNDSYSSAYEDGTVFELLDDDSFQLYEVSGPEIRLLKHFRPPGTLARNSALFVCGKQIIQVGDAITKVLSKPACKVVAEHKRTRGNLLFGDLEQTRVFVNRGDAIFVFDPDTGSWSKCATAPKNLGASVAGERLLARHKDAISIIDLTTGKTVKLGASKLA